jgi:hypothetical protein
LGNLVFSTKKLNDDHLPGELDALCTVLEGAEHNVAPIRGV